MEEIKEKQDKDRVRELMVICNDTKRRNPHAREELHDLINLSKTAKQFVEMQHGIYQIALRTRIDSMDSSDALKEVMFVKCAQLKEELGYSTATQLEKLAIEQIVISSVVHYENEINHARVLSQPSF